MNSPAHVRRAGRDAGGPRPVAGRPAYVVVAGKMRQSNKSPQQSELTACGDMITVLLLHASIDPARDILIVPGGLIRSIVILILKEYVLTVEASFDTFILTIVNNMAPVEVNFCTVVGR